MDIEVQDVEERRKPGAPSVPRWIASMTVDEAARILRGMYDAGAQSRGLMTVPFACGVRRLKVPMTIGGDTPKAN